MAKNIVKLTLHNGEEVLINWDSVAFATTAKSDNNGQVYTKLVFDTNAGEIDVKEPLDQVQHLVLASMAN